MGKHYVVAWRVEDLSKENRNDMVEEFAPELFLFGSNGASEVFAFDTRKLPFSIVAVPLS